MRSKPVVTMMIPTYNRANALKQALNSVFAMDGIDEKFRLEVIVVDDASTDATPEVLRTYPAVKCIRLDKNQGAAACRNIAIKASEGEYITFIDDDDLVLPYKVVHQLPALQANPELGLVYSEMIGSYKNSIFMWPEPDNHPSGFVFLNMFLRPFTSTQTVMIRREAFDNTGWFDESLPVCVDYDMILRLSLKYPFAFCPGPVAIYRLSRDGVYLRHLREGRYEESLHRVIQKAMTLAVQLGIVDGLGVREIGCYVNLQMAQRWASDGDPQVICDHVLRAVRQDRHLAQDESARPLAAKLFVQAALRTDSPIDFTLEFAKQISETAGQHDAEARRYSRKLLADVWWFLAVEFKKDNTAVASGAAGYAAARALCIQPKLLGRTALNLMAHSLVSLVGTRFRS